MYSCALVTFHTDIVCQTTAQRSSNDSSEACKQVNSYSVTLFAKNLIYFQRNFLTKISSIKHVESTSTRVEEVSSHFEFNTDFFHGKWEFSHFEVMLSPTQDFLLLKMLLFLHFFRFMDKRMMLKLNGGRSVTGILRGFDPFMNVVIDETVEECRDGTKNNIGMVVCLLVALNCHFNSKFIYSSN